MSETIKVGWLKNNEGEKFAPKTLMSQVVTNDGVQLNDKIEADLLSLKQEVNAYAEQIANEAISNLEISELDTHINDNNIHVTDTERTDWNDAKAHSDSVHARTDATKTEKSETNGNVLINGIETTVYVHPEGTNPHGTTKDDLGLENVENKSSETIRSEITKENVTNALGYTPPTTDTTYDAAGENLGLVKTGGDLTIVDGVATVNDLDSKVPETRTVNGKALSTNITLSASDVGADVTGTASTLVSAHNVDTDSHNDIRDLITSLTDRLNALANSTDEELDQMAEIVDYIKANKSLIESVTTTKVNVSDIVNNLTTNTDSKVLSASQGVAIKTLIDALQTEVNSKANSSDLTAHTEDVTAHITSGERDSWNNAKVHAESTHAPSDAQVNVIETVKVNGTTLTPNSKAVDITVPTKLSDLTNDGGFLTDYTETDPTVPAWAKEPTKPIYTYEEVGADKKGSANVALTDAKTYTDDKITELSEQIAYISEDNEEIGNIINTVLTTGDIVDNLNSSSDTMVLSARQGSVLNGRIDTMQALPEGSTTADAALYDINIGYDGTDWKSPGAAVRGQISQLSSEIDKQRATNYPYPFTLDSTLIGSDDVTKFYTPKRGGIKKLLIHDNTNIFDKFWVYTFYATDKEVALVIRGDRKDTSTPFFAQYKTKRDIAEESFTINDPNYPTISIECVVDWDNVNAGYGQSLTVERACISESCIDRRINKNTIIVGKDLNYADFTTIQSAVDFAKDGDIIYIMPGEYEESVSYTKDISLVGANKLTTVLFNTTGLYDTPPLYTCSGKIENLTIEMRRDDNTTYPEIRLGYALHLDQKWNTDHSKRKIEIRNCIFKSDFSDCIGCGIEADSVIDISDCICIPNSERASGLKVHPYPVVGYSSDLYLRNNVFYSTDGESSYGILLHTGGTDGINYNTVNVHAWNNISKSYNGIDTNCFIIDDYNSGNSLSVLNG